jgi:SAM-dependent methyltransferase
MFDLYAAYYDLLYRDKDYAAEARWVETWLPGGGQRMLDILELGCGTGGHAFALAAAGHRVEGVDLSAGMVARARERAAVTPGLAPRLAFAQGDLRTHRSGRLHDAVITLFHVMSYQTGNDDLAAACTTARAHLAPGGRFVFDCWYGPAVLSDRPRHVRKAVHDERIEVERVTTPTMVVNANRVDVRFDVHIRSRADGREQQLHELHPMRYLFLPELDLLLQAAGLRRVAARAWLGDAEPDDRSWYACVVAEAV